MVRSLCKVLLILFFCVSFSSCNHTSPNVLSFTREDVLCLAKNIYYESRGEPKIGQIAVAHVTLNRLADPEFPDTICEVITQKKQFSWVNSKRLEAPIDSFYQDLAISILSGKYSDPTDGARFFHALHVKPFKRERIMQIGNHIFYR